MLWIESSENIYILLNPKEKLIIKHQQFGNSACHFFFFFFFLIYLFFYPWVSEVFLNVDAHPQSHRHSECERTNPSPHPRHPPPPPNVRKVLHVRPAKIQISLRIRAVWSESSLGAFCIAEDAKFVHANNENSNQIARMRRLIWVFVRHACQKVRFLMLWLISKLPLDYRPDILRRYFLKGKNNVDEEGIWAERILQTKHFDTTLTHLCWVDSSTLILWTGPFPVKGVSG